MSWIVGIIWFVLGAVAASAAARARVRQAEDFYFFRGWAACLKKLEDENPEVRRA